MPRRRPTYTLAARLRRDLASRSVLRRLGRRVFHRLLPFSLIAVWLLLPYADIYHLASVGMVGGQLVWPDAAPRPFLDTAVLLVPDPGLDGSLEGYVPVSRNLDFAPVATPADATVWNWVDPAGVFYLSFAPLPYRLQLHRPGCARVDLGPYRHSGVLSFWPTSVRLDVPSCEPVGPGAEAASLVAAVGGEP